MNRSWFRLPFGGGNSSNSQQQQQQDEDDEVELSHDSGELLPALNRQQRYHHSNTRRSKMSSSSGGGGGSHTRRDYIKHSISGPYPSPLATTSDTASYATAHASSATSECSTAGSSHPDHHQHHDEQQQQQQHAHTASLHSISSIRTSHFTARSSHFERLQRSTTPDGSLEVSPSKTPLRDRLNRLSIASTASGMVNFDDEDREEAERRWLEEEEIEQQAGSRPSSLGGHSMGESSPLAQVQEADEEDDNQLSASSEDEMGSEEEEERDFRRAPHMTPSRSSTSIKSILKKSIASAEGIAASNVSIHATAITATTTPHRTVTWSPSTLPPAKSPPVIDVSPEHPRGPLAAAEAYLLNLGQRQQDEYYQGFDSPYRRVLSTDNNKEDESIISSEDSAMEIEEALLSRSSNSISPHNLSAASDTNTNAEESSNSLKLQGSSSRRGTAFMDRLKGLIPSPENSFEGTQHAQKDQDKDQVAYSTKSIDPSMSNILDTSAPMHSVSHDVTVNDTHANTTLRQTSGPKPFLLRQSVIIEEPSMLEESVEHRCSQNKSSTSPVNSPDRSTTTAISGGQSFVTALQQASLGTVVVKPAKEDKKAAKATIETSAAVPKVQDTEIFETPAEETGQPIREAARIAEVDEETQEDELEVPDASPSPSLRALPTITPSSSSSSIIKVKPESPFTSLVNHLLSTQDELLSHRADQKTMLISLVSNLRGELASRDRQLDTLETSKKSLERQLRKEKEEREKDKLQTKERISIAFKEVDDIKNKLVLEIKRREDAFREELLHEKTKRDLIEKQLESLKRDHHDGGSFEEIELLRNQLQDAREALDEERLSSEHTAQELARTTALLDESNAERIASERRLEASEKAQEEAQARVDIVSEECNKLRKQSAAADKQLAKYTADFEHQMTHLRTRLTQSESTNAKLKRELEDITHCLHHERLEQTRQYDMSASVQESLRIDNEKLMQSVAKLERSKEHSFQQLQVIKKDTAAVLAQKEERLAQLEAEILKRSLDRRTQISRFDEDGECTSCKESNERNQFLESEIVRLRESISKMRMESSDREVKISRLIKTREQLKEDINGLNIALEAKQMELSMLKRESHHRLSAGNVTENGAASVAQQQAGGISMIGMTTSTTRPRSRILSKGRPSSVHDTTAQGIVEGASNGSNTFTTEQRRRSLRARTSVVNPGKRISIHRSSIDTPSVLSTINANSASGNTLNPTLTSRRSSSKDPNANDGRHEKALEAASLVKSGAVSSGKTTSSTIIAEKENMVVSNDRDKAQQRVRDLPSAPSHPIEQAQQQIDIRKRSNSLVIPVEA